MGVLSQVFSAGRSSPYVIYQN